MANPSNAHSAHNNVELASVNGRLSGLILVVLMILSSGFGEVMMIQGHYVSHYEFKEMMIVPGFHPGMEPIPGGSVAEWMAGVRGVMCYNPCYYDARIGLVTQM